MAAQTQSLFLLFRAAERTSDPLSAIDEFAYEHAAGLDSPNSPDFERAREAFAESWSEQYQAWVDLGRPTIVGGYSV